MEFSTTTIWTNPAKLRVRLIWHLWPYSLYVSAMWVPDLPELTASSVLDPMSMTNSVSTWQTGRPLSSEPANNWRREEEITPLLRSGSAQLENLLRTSVSASELIKYDQPIVYGHSISMWDCSLGSLTPKELLKLSTSFELHNAPI